MVVQVYQGSVTRNGGNGRVFDPADEARKFSVDLFLNGSVEPFITAPAHHYDGEGYSLFQVQWPHTIAPNDQITGQVRETGQPLAAAPRSPGYLQWEAGLYSRRHDYVVHFQPKAACTLVRRLFGYLHQSEAEKELDLRAPQEVVHAFLATPQDIRADTLSVIAVRHPFQRVVSMFIDKVASYSFLRRLCRGYAVFAYHFGEDVQSYEQLSFLQFLEYLQSYAQVADSHFQPQVCLAGDHQVWRVESLEQDIKTFYSQYRPDLLPAAEQYLEEGPRRHNPSSNTLLGEGHLLEDAPAAPISLIGSLIKEGRGILPDSFLTDQTRAMIAEIYAKDIVCYYPDTQI